MPPPDRTRPPAAKAASPRAGAVLTGNIRAGPLQRRRVGTACVLGLLAFVVYLTNLRPMGGWDSVPARLLPFSILREGNLDLDEFPWLRRLNPNPYFLRHGPQGHWLSGYPVGVPVLVTPLFVPAVWWLHRQQIADNDVRFRLASVVMERVSAALIAAVSVSFVFLAVSLYASAATSAGVTLAYAFGTSTWSIGSQALWQHGLAAMGLAGLSLCLLAPETRRNAVAAGGFASLAVLARPTMVVFALLAVIFVWRERRAQLLAFLALPVIGLSMLLAYNLRLVGVLSGAYQRGRFTWPLPARLVGLLFSPNRGLFVYTPAAVLAVAGMLQRDARRPRWVAYLPLGVGGYLVLYSAWQGWWGGHSYGPRFLTDVLPALVLCAVPAVERWWRTYLARGALLLLLVWGVVVQLIGVYCDDHSWDAQPQSVNKAPWRVWDWTDPQILRAARTGWHGADLAPLLWQTLTDPRPALVQPLAASDLVGEIRLADPLPLVYPHASSAVLRLRLVNRSTVTWPAFSDFGYLQVAFVYRWWQGQTPVSGEGGFVALPRNLGPGESTGLRAHIDTPPRRGDYTFELDLMQVLNLAEGASGGTVLRVPVHIE